MRTEHLQGQRMSLSQYRREREEWERKHEQKVKMNNRMVNVDNGYYQQSVNTAYGKSMGQALQEVRKNSHITHNQELTSFNGTAIHNGLIKPS